MHVNEMSILRRRYESLYFSVLSAIARANLMARNALPLFLLFVANAVLGQDLSGDPPLVIEDLQCRGNTATSCSFILGQVYLLPGNEVDEEEIGNARLRLSSLTNFESVGIFLEKGSARGKAVVVVEVVEASPIFTEWVAGPSERRDTISQFVAGRLSHQNLFGEGKILDFTARGRIPLDGPELSGGAVNLRYADPHLFGSKKYFFFAGMGYGEIYEENEFDELLDVEEGGIGFSVGRRLWDFSYLVIGYDYYPTSRIFFRELEDDGTYTTEEREVHHSAFISYGWNSEDDYYFPTRGSAFVTSVGARFADGGETFGNLFIQFRKTWQTKGGSLWTIKLGGEPRTEFRPAITEGPLLTVGFARPLSPDNKLGLERGRWYVEPGLDDYDAGTRNLFDFVVKVGVRFELKSFGLVDLYAIADLSR